jgi:hydrogenase expression/formation protein HypC
MCLAVPGKIVSVTGEDPWTRTARVSFGGVVKEINLAYVPDARVDDYVIVHAGFALSQIDEAEALRTFEELAKLADLSDELRVAAEDPSGGISKSATRDVAGSEIPPEGTP